MKKADFITNLVQVPLDFIFLVLAGISAYSLRFSPVVSNWRAIIFEMPFGYFFNLTWQMSLAGVIILAIIGAYTMKSKKLVKEIPRVVSGISTLFVIIILYLFLQLEQFSSRFIIVFSWLFAVVYLTVIRMIVAWIRNQFFRRSWGLSGVVLLGSSENRELIAKEYKNNPALGFKVLAEFDNLASLEKSEKIKDLVDSKKIDYVVQTDSTMDKTEALDLLTWCQENHLSLKYVANLFQAQSLHLILSSEAGIPLVEIAEIKLQGWGRVAKRIFDFIIAILLIIVLSPLLLFLGLMVKLTSRGPMCVGLRRVGAKGKVFTMYKFRSMVNNAHELKAKMMDLNERPDGPLFKMKNDPRVTSFGRWLRKTSLDELPQLFNVVKGQMSLVGPRPHEPEEVSRYQKGYKRLLSIKPGMTGMAQVSGRSNLLFADEAKLDIFYMENWSLLLDFIIIIKTPLAIIKNEEGY